MWMSTSPPIPVSGRKEAKILPRWGRERAAFLLGVVARKEMPRVAEPALARMVAAHALARQGERYVATDQQ